MKFNSRVRLKICIFFNLKIKAHNLYNPYTCYQVQAGTTNFYQSRTNCRSKGLRTTTMIIRTRAEYADAGRFVALFGGGYFWVSFFFLEYNEKLQF